ncbi:sulfatase [bacterium]|nr:sulfatase [bacterium]MDB4561665.1 sulfatase [bacterium]
MAETFTDTNMTAASFTTYQHFRFMMPIQYRTLLTMITLLPICILSCVTWGAEQDTVPSADESAKKQPVNVQPVNVQPVNVLFIAVDDLRPLLGCYGDTTAVTPHLDRLASRGTVFQRAYCQQALCSPSRLSLLTGKRPDTTRVWDLATHFRTTLPDAITLPQYFKQNGYQTQGIGKILHGNGKPASDPPSWTHEPLFSINRDPRLRYALKENLNGSGLKRSATESAEVSDATYIDGKVCEAAIERLTEFKADGKPFFLAVGFRKPHLPFCAPSRFWDLYKRANIPSPSPKARPTNAPELATRSWRELEGYSDIPSDGKLSAAEIQQLRHGYYACVSYIDEQIGRVLKHLSQLQLTGNTLVVVWGDHGFHLGEQQLWTKANNYELSTRVPLIVALPQNTSDLTIADDQKNRNVCPNLVELVDLYPTLTEACGLPCPDGLEGTSFYPLLKNPLQPWKSAAFSQHPRSTTSNRHKGHGNIMGYAVRTHRYRYIEWKEWKTGKIVAHELYDYNSSNSETENCIGNPRYAKAHQELRNILAAGWEAARPSPLDTP